MFLEPVYGWKFRIYKEVSAILWTFYSPILNLIGFQRDISEIKTIRI